VQRLEGHGGAVDEFCSSELAEVFDVRGRCVYDDAREAEELEELDGWWIKESGISFPAILAGVGIPY
jgi:hypothetical protein